MFSMFFGEEYHDKIREMLSADELLLPNRFIDGELNVGATTRLMGSVFGKFGIDLGNVEVATQKAMEMGEKVFKMQEVARNYHCGVLCTMLLSRTKQGEFSIPKYKKRWFTKRVAFMETANKAAKELVESV